MQGQHPLCHVFLLQFLVRHYTSELHKGHMELGVPLWLSVYQRRVLLSIFIHGLWETGWLHLLSDRFSWEWKIIKGAFCWRFMFWIPDSLGSGVERWPNIPWFKPADDFYICTQDSWNYFTSSRSDWAGIAWEQCLKSCTALGYCPV